MHSKNTINLTNELDSTKITKSDQAFIGEKLKAASFPLSDEQIQHPLNQALLEEAMGIKEERNTLKSRLQKLDENRTSVSGNVYQKVRKEYLALLSKTTDRLLALKKSLESEQARILGKKVLAESRLMEHRENAEEAELRFSLGEYSAEKREEILHLEKEEMGRLETALRVLEESLQKHLDILQGEDFVAEQALQQKAPIQESPTPTFLDSRKRMEIVTPEPEPAPEVDEDIQEEIDQIIEEVPESMTPPPPLATSHENTHRTTPSTMTKPRAEDTPTPHALKFADIPTEKKLPQIEVLSNGQVIQKLPVDKTIQIGRSPANDVVLNEPKVSRKHAEIQLTAGKYILLDLESSNGTYVGGKKISEYTLQSGDEIIIGNTKMIFKS